MIRNVFAGGDGGVATTFGANAWAMYPRPDIDPIKEYKGPAQYGGKVTWRIGNNSMGALVSDGGDNALMRYLKSVGIADGDELAVAIIPRHWRLKAITYQVRLPTETSGVNIGDTAGTNTGITGAVDIIVRTPAAPQVGLATASDLTVAAAVSLASTTIGIKEINATTAPANALSNANRLLVLKFGTAPSVLGKVNFEVTLDIEPVMDIMQD